MRAKGNKQNAQLISALRQFDSEVSENFGSLSPNHYKNYSFLIKLVANIQNLFVGGLI
jgi:hypothetical protein